MPGVTGSHWHDEQEGVNHICPIAYTYIQLRLHVVRTNRKKSTQNVISQTPPPLPHSLTH